MKHLTSWGLLGLALLTAQANAAQHKVDNVTVDSTRYRCDDGLSLDVTYVNVRKQTSLVVVRRGDIQIAMRQAPAASGARYVDLDEQRGMRWHVKGDSGLLERLAADHTATEQLLARCRETS